MSFGKWIGGALGWAMGGPIGGIIGFAIGAMADDKSFKGVQSGQASNTHGQRSYGQYRHQTQSGDFASALLVLSAAVMKADNRLLKSELDFIRDFYTRQFGSAAAAQHIGVLKELLQKDIPVREVCEQIRYYMEHPMRLQLMYYLFGIAKADGNVDKDEMRIIELIAQYIGLNNKDYESLKAMHYKDTESAFKILEIESSASDEEVKKAFRKMAMKYHPDKVRGLGEQHEKSANEKFIKVQEAYEQIKKERNMK
jgi:DnaJ like chaperone protein